MDSVLSEMKKRGFPDEEALEIVSQMRIKCIADFGKMSVIESVYYHTNLWSILGIK